MGDTPPAEPVQVIAVLLGLTGSTAVPKAGENGNVEVFRGRFFVGLSPLRVPGYYLAAAMLDNRDVLGQEVELSGPATLKMVYKTGGGSVRGKVEGGAATVVVAMADATAAGRLGWSAACDAEGGFTLANLAPGEYTVAAFRDRRELNDAGFLSSLAAGGERVKVEEGAVATVALRVN